MKPWTDSLLIGSCLARSLISPECLWPAPRIPILHIYPGLEWSVRVVIAGISYSDEVS